MRRLWTVFAVMSGFAIAVVLAVPVCAQMSEVKEKPPMYSYVGNWAIPRAQWGDMEKQIAANQKIMEKAFANGTIIGYGSDTNLIHTPDGGTHDTWWSAMSQAGVLNALDQVYKAGNATSPVFAAATKHWDGLYVSRFYNWHPGSWKDVYTRVAMYTLKKDAPEDAVEMLSKHLFVPIMEKLLADGAIHEYEIDTEAIHTENPGDFSVVIIGPADGLDKFSAAVQELMKEHPLAHPGVGAIVDLKEHRDFLMRTDATYK